MIHLRPSRRAWLHNDGAGRTYSELPAPPEPGEGWLARDYSYDGDHPHAVASVSLPSGGPGTYTYDLNGNTLAPHSRRTPGRCAFGAHLPWVQVPGVQV